MAFNLQAETTYSQLCDLVPERFHLSAKIKTLPTFSVKNGYWYEHEKLPDGKIKQHALLKRTGNPEEYVSAKKQEILQLKEKHTHLLKLEQDLIKMLRPLYGGMDRDASRILYKFAEVGLTTERSMLIGTNAFLSYAPLYGWEKASFFQRTGDVDIVAYSDRKSFKMFSKKPLDFEKILESTGLKFDPCFNYLSGGKPTRFQSQTGYFIDLLASGKGAPGKKAVVDIPGVTGAGAEVLSFMDFLINEKKQTVLLGTSYGIPATVPTPERFAVHKLLIAPLRNEDQQKRKKDFLQAKKIINSIFESDYTADLVDVWNEAVDRGPSARRSLKKSMAVLDDKTIESLSLAGAEMSFAIHKKKKEFF